MAPTSLGQSFPVDAIVKLNFGGAWAHPFRLYIESGDTDTAKIVNRYSPNAITIDDDILYDGVANGTKVQRINVKSLNNRLGCYKYNESSQYGQCTSGKVRLDIDTNGTTSSNIIGRCYWTDVPKHLILQMMAQAKT